MQIEKRTLIFSIKIALGHYAGHNVKLNVNRLIIRTNSNLNGGDVMRCCTTKVLVNKIDVTLLKCFVLLKDGG